MYEKSLKSSEKKKKHHYVWAYYLKNWSDNDRDVWRITEKNKVEKYSVNGILFDFHFYKIRDLDADHIAILKLLFKNADPETHKMINDLIEFRRFLDIALSLECNEVNRLEYEKILTIESNFIENFHTRTENNARKIIDSLVNEDLSILEDDNNLLSFLVFISHQMTRTKAMKENTLVYIKTKNDFLASKLDECWWIISYFMAINLGRELWVNRHREKHCLLINNTDESFITSDNPVINVHPSVQVNSKKILSDDEFDVYYPISPRVAYMINNSEQFNRGKNFISVETVINLNIKMAENSYRHIVSDTEQGINSYKKHVGKWANFLKN